MFTKWMRKVLAELDTVQNMGQGPHDPKCIPGLPVLCPIRDPLDWIVSMWFDRHAEMKNGRPVWREYPCSPELDVLRAPTWAAHVNRIYDNPSLLVSFYAKYKGQATHLVTPETYGYWLACYYPESAVRDAVTKFAGKKVAKNEVVLDGPLDPFLTPDLVARIASSQAKLFRQWYDFLEKPVHTLDGLR